MSLWMHGKRAFWGLSLLALCGLARAEIQFVPVAQLDVLGGQFFFEGTNTSFSGNGDWLLAPGVKFSDRWSIIPTVNGKYRRVREVQELIGGGFLTQENLENSASLKGIYTWNENWKTKLKAGYKNQMIVESADETLNHGLFDNNKYSAGIELERTGEKLRSLRLSLDPYQVKFVRYQTLSSGSQFGSEINSGGRTLDFDAYDATLSAESLVTPTTLISGSALGSLRPFPEQNIVTSAGTYSSSLRQDIYSQTALGAAQKLPDWVPHVQAIFGLDVSYTFLDSNQNNYDASRTQFNENYYDYGEYHLTPKIGGKVFAMVDWTLVYDYSRRDYGSRPIQTSDGTYGTDKIYTNTHTFSYSLKYSWKYGLSLLASGSYLQSSSNMAYEKTYRYNYNAQHYFAGIGWEY